MLAMQVHVHVMHLNDKHDCYKKVILWYFYNRYRSLREELDREFSEETLHVSSWHRWQRIESEISKKIVSIHAILFCIIGIGFVLVIISAIVCSR